MKKTLFSLLACATLAGPAMAYDWSSTITLTLPALDITKLTGNGNYCDLTGQYSSSDITSTYATVRNASATYTTNNGPTDINLSVRYQEWNGNTYVITLTASGENPADNSFFNLKPCTVTLELKPTNLTGVINGYDYTNATLRTEVETDPVSSQGNPPNATASVSSWTVSGATTPEPATATLSLLALAGLAVRRRRH